MWTVPLSGAAHPLTFQQDCESLGSQQAHNQSPGWEGPNPNLSDTGTQEEPFLHRSFCARHALCAVSAIGIHQIFWSLFSFALLIPSCLCASVLCIHFPCLSSKSGGSKQKQAPNRSLFSVSSSGIPNPERMLFTLLVLGTSSSPHPWLVTPTEHNTTLSLDLC